MSERTPLLTVVRVETVRPRYPHSALRRFCSIFLAVALVIVLILFLLPLTFLPHPEGSPRALYPWSRPYPHASWPRTAGLSSEELQTILLQTPDEEKAREWSKYYAAGPHLAGRNLTQALWTRSKWEEFGIRSEIVAYDVYLNYPVDHRLALLKLDDGQDRKAEKGHQVTYECSLEEDVLEEDPTTGLEDRVPTFHGYSASGNVTAPFVFANFGTFQDFEDLVRTNITLEGKIALVKYGRIFRGLKTKRAQELGMVGIVIYTDPQEDGDITELNGYKAYPAGPARNPSSVQRGSTSFLSILAGDPTTPGYASKPGVPRVDPHYATPTIPSIPISYRDAIPLLKALNGYGPKASDYNEAWQHGGLAHKGVEYNIGPSPPEVVLNLMNDQEYVITPIWDVIGIVNGSVPDEAVIVGNHRDAWIAGGAGDPNSGSSALNEVVRSFGKAIEEGYRPLRTIVFCSWDGEEYGLVGSSEWVEEHLPWLSKSSLAYINLDDNPGTHFRSTASPLLIQALQEVTSIVPSPNQTVKGQTVFDLWGGATGTIGSGSDYTAFEDFAGTASIDIGFKRGSGDPVYHYHSNYDSFYWMDNFGDPGFHYHVAAAQVLGLLTAKLAESPVASFNATDYSAGLKEYLQRAKNTAVSSNVSISGTVESKTASKASFSFTRLENALNSLEDVSQEFDTYAANLADELVRPLPWWKWWQKLQTFYAVRKVNTKYKNIERQMLYQGGLDDRTFFKHVVFAPGRWTGYAGATFPGLVESFEDGNVTNAERWENIILGCIDNVAELLTVET